MLTEPRMKLCDNRSAPHDKSNHWTLNKLVAHCTFVRRPKIPSPVDSSFFMFLKNGLISNKPWRLQDKIKIHKPLYCCLTRGGIQNTAGVRVIFKQWKKISYQDLVGCWMHYTEKKKAIKRCFQQRFYLIECLKTHTSSIEVYLHISIWSLFTLASNCSSAVLITTADIVNLIYLV